MARRARLPHVHLAARLEARRPGDDSCPQLPVPGPLSLRAAGEFVAMAVENLRVLAIIVGLGWAELELFTLTLGTGRVRTASQPLTPSPATGFTLPHLAP